jgi:hypothetical protein
MKLSKRVNYFYGYFVVSLQIKVTHSDSGNTMAQDAVTYIHVAVISVKLISISHCMFVLLITELCTLLSSYLEDSASVNSTENSVLTM